MAKKKQKITVGGNRATPGQTTPRTIIITQPKRFGIDIADFTSSVRSFENVDYSTRYKLYDLYADIMMDTHLSSVIDKRILAVLSSPIEFNREGEIDEQIMEQIKSPWFRNFIKDVMMAKLWGFSLFQFYKKKEWITYDLIPRKHVDPTRKLILRRQTDITGTSWDEFSDLLFVGSADDMGLLAKAAPWVIYKRNTAADWAQFAEIFGMPIREYIYETDDDDARQRAIDDAENTGSLGVLIHSKDSDMRLIESGSKTGSAELYEGLVERANNEISKLILGNTLTTEASSTGTQALGTVHKKVEDRLTMADRNYILDVLNYEMTDILLAMGVNTQGGEFFFTDPQEVDLREKADIFMGLSNSFGLPISDDFLYEQFGIERPADYDKIIRQKQEEREERKRQLELMANPIEPQGNMSQEAGTPPNGVGNSKKDLPLEKTKSPKPTNSLFSHIKSFFVKAPRDGAALGW